MPKAGLAVGPREHLRHGRRLSVARTSRHTLSVIRLLPTLLAAIGCIPAEPASQIVVVVSTDIEVPSGMDGFGARVRDRSGRARSDRSFPLGGGSGSVELPADFGVAPLGGDVTRTVTIEIDANLGEETLFTTRAVTSFLEDRTLRLDMFLADRCLREAPTCREDETCRREGCVPAEIEPGDLPGFSADDWIRPIGGEGDAWPIDGAVDPDGNLYVTGWSTGPVDFGDGPTDSPTDPALFLASWGPTGELRWAKTFAAGDPLDLGLGGGVDVDGAGAVLLTSTFTGSVDFGDGEVEPEGERSAFVARYSADGDLRDLVVWPNGRAMGRDVAAAPDGRIAVTGEFGDTIDFGDGGVLEGGSIQELYLVVLDQYLRHLWSRLAPGSFSSPGRAVDFDAQGNLCAAGAYEGSTNLGGDDLPSTGQFSVFVASYDRAGSHRWSRGVGGNLDQPDSFFDDDSSDVVAENGGCAVAGWVSGDANFGDGVVPDRGVRDGFVAGYGPSGEYRFAHLTGGVGDDAVQAVEASTGELHAAGFFAGDAEVGSAPLRSGGGIDVFRLDLDPDGEPTRAQGAGGSGDEIVTDLLVDEGRDAQILIGYFGGTAVLGPNVLASAGTDGFVWRVTP